MEESRQFEMLAWCDELVLAFLLYDYGWVKWSIFGWIDACIVVCVLWKWDSNGGLLQVARVTCFGDWTYECGD